MLSSVTAKKSNLYCEKGFKDGVLPVRPGACRPKEIVDSFVLTLPSHYDNKFIVERRILICERCLRPPYIEYLKFRNHCNECLCLFSSPIPTKCAHCHPNFLGWRTLTSLLKERIRNPLTHQLGCVILPELQPTKDILL